MNLFWSFFVIVSSIVLIVTNPGGILGAFTDGATKAINFALVLLPIYAIWLGIIEIMDKSNLSGKISKLLMPLIGFLFGPQDEETKQFIATNMAANLIGVGGAATPSGIEAAKRMQGDDKKIKKSTMMLIILNASSLQIVPTTIISMRQAQGAANPSSIFLPVLITSILTTFIAVMLVKVFVKEDKTAARPILKLPSIR